MTDPSRDDLRDVAQYVANHPDAEVMDVVGGLALPPIAKPVVEDLLETADPLDAVDDLATDADTDPQPREDPREGELSDEAQPADVRDGEEERNPENGPDGAEDAARAAFDDAIRYFAANVDATIHEHTDDSDHPDRPTTARDYFAARGWDDEIIEELYFGWAPPSRTGLLEHLQEAGHDRKAILATGLFTDDLTPLWQGRYVLPYFDVDGHPVYAIARCTGDKGGGAAGYDGHTSDYLAGKYAKIRHTDDRVPFEEPIWGHHTLADSQPLVVAEGIADAITAAEAGYSVLSPVAKEFKKEHYGPLVEAITRFDVPRVTVIPDSERAGFDRTDTDGEVDTIGEQVTIPPASPGMGGALRTADALKDRLEDADTSVRVADLPLPARSDEFHKVDLDDYLQTWADSLDALLLSAKPADAYPDYEAATASRTTTSDDTDSADAEHVGTGQSRLWDLDLGDLEGLRDGDRTKNPFAHKGDSETYFVVRKQAGGDLIATDYKGNGGSVTYNALTALLVDAGERRRDDPEGPLSDREVWYAWKQARKRGDLGVGDPVPYRSLRGLALEDGLVDEADLVDRDSDTGEIVEDSNGDTYRALPPGVYDSLLEHITEEYGLDPGREPTTADDAEEDPDEYAVDPRRIIATVDPRRAWEAAGRVTPDELDEPLSVAHTDDGEAWLVNGERVDVVRAAAVSEGLAETASDPITDSYPEAYQLARDRYGAPLPAYYTTADAIARFDAVLDVVAELTYWDLDADVLNSDVTATGDGVNGAAVRSLDPAWRESESGESVLVFDSGNVWDADTERSLAALRFVALDSGVLEGPTDAWDDGEFSTAYQLAREEYGAPLPRWEPAHGGEHDHTAQLPDPGDLADARPYDGVDTDALGDARQDVEALLQDAMTDPDDPTVVRALPATGKTTGAVKIAAGATDDDRPGIPATYLAPRKELQKQALEKADRWGADADVLPVFSDETVADKVLTAAVSHVREAGKQRLRDRWAVLSTAAEAVDEDLEDLNIFADGDEEAVNLDRPTCETADGDHGDAWALAVHVARRLGYTPREIHTQARGLFGAPLPCMCDDHGVDVSHLEGEGCRYSLGWSDVADPDDPADLLVGSYVHAHVESARTHYNRGPDSEVVKTPRAVVLDEFIGEAFSREFGAEALDFATWLAASLREDVDDRRDMYEADLAGDGWVTAWLDGDGGEHDGARDVAGTLARYGDLLDAREAAAEIRREVDTGLLEGFDLDRPLASLADHDDPVAAFRELAGAVAAVDPKQPGASVAHWVEDDVAQPLRRATNDGEAAPSLADVDTDALPFGGDLAQLVEKAVDAVEAAADGACETVRAAVTALRGGREGCRRLAAWADDGYAHPDAHHLLEAVITPTDADADDPGARRIDTDAWAFDPDATDGTVLDVVDTGDRARALLDRNDHGAILHTPPAREAGNGDPAPLVGLDATARRELWATALLEDVRVKDIHDTPAERATFLEEALDLRVLQASDQPRPYEGDPATKDTDGDVALLEALADEYSGISAPRARGDAPTTVGKPAAVTTKGVRSVLEDDDRLDDVVAAWEHYGNHTGSNDLGSHRLAALLGCQHYGDDAVERFAALGGESVDTDRRDGRGAELAYGSPLGDAYLKHMQKDQTMQAVLRFARGGSGATVVARTSALREDLPVVGRAQVVETWSDTAATIAGAYRRLGDHFTADDVADTVDVSTRQVRRVLAELVEAGYLRHVGGGDGTAKVYEPAGSPGAGEVDLPERGAAVANAADPGRAATNEYYTWNVRVAPAESYFRGGRTGVKAAPRGAPPAPRGEAAGPPPG